MRKLFYCLFVFALLPTILLAAKSDSDRLLLQRLLSNIGDEYLSGKATLICIDYSKAFSEEDFIRQKEFADDKEKQLYLKNIALHKGVKFSLDQDRIRRTVEVLCFSGEKRRRDFVSVSPEQILSLKKNPELINDLSLQVFTYVPEKTILVSSSIHEGEKFNYANITKVRIFFPKFNYFAHGKSVKNLETFMKYIDDGLSTVSKIETGDEIRVVLEGGKSPHNIKMERVIDKSKNMAILYSATSMNGQVQNETTCSDYKKTSDDHWYPHSVVSNKYVYLNDQKILASSMTYETIPGSVSFNLPIDDIVFEPRLADGTYVTDDRYDPPWEYEIRGK